MNFYDTKLGDIFFNAQLPALIDALKQIADALDKPAPAPIKLSADVPPDYLTELYYGNLDLSMKIDSDELRQHTRDAIGIQEKLKDRLSAEDWELVTQLTTLIGNRACDESAKSFQAGFCTAIQMVTAGLSGTGITNAEAGGDAHD